MEKTVSNTILVVQPARDPGQQARVCRLPASAQAHLFAVACLRKAAESLLGDDKPAPFAELHRLALQVAEEEEERALGSRLEGYGCSYVEADLLSKGHPDLRDSAAWQGPWSMTHAALTEATSPEPAALPAATACLHAHGMSDAAAGWLLRAALQHGYDLATSALLAGGPLAEVVATAEVGA